MSEFPQIESEFTGTPMEKLHKRFVSTGYQPLEYGSLYRIKSGESGLDSISEIRGEAVSNSLVLGGKYPSPQNEELIGFTPGKKIVAFKTDSGGEQSKYGTKNEDGFYVGIRQKRLVVGVFDGAGGSGHGELASCTGMVSAAENILREKKNIWDAAKIIDEDIKKEARGGYAAAVLADVVEGPNDKKLVALAWAGDCKAMTIREGKKLEEGSTSFQNVAQEEIDAKKCLPQDYYNHPEQHVLTSALGGGKGYVPEKKSFFAKNKDLLIIASDGFWDRVSEYEILKLSHEHQTPHDLQSALYNLAYKRNNLDPIENPSFEIQFSESIKVKKILKKRYSGDNITIGVVEL